MTKFIFCHHGERSDRGLGVGSEKYWGLTMNGVAETRKKAEVLVKTINDVPNSSAIILGGCSKAIRTKSTLMVFIDELRRIYEKEKGIIFSQPFNPAMPLYALKETSERMESNGKKAIVDFPLTIEEFISLQGQRECTVVRKLLTGLCGAEGFFRRFFPNNPIVLVSVGHSPEMDALINFLHKENGSVRISDKVDFHFM